MRMVSIYVCVSVTTVTLITLLQGCARLCTSVLYIIVAVTHFSRKVFPSAVHISYSFIFAESPDGENDHGSPQKGPHEKPQESKGII